VREGGGRGMAEAQGGWAGRWTSVGGWGRLLDLSKNGGARPRVGVKSPRFVGL
jgi:hypothetical protein